MYFCFALPIVRATFTNTQRQRPLELVPKLFGPIRERYANRPGGCTRVLRIEPLKEDQAPSAILELVDGPKDMRFALTAQTVARDRLLNRPQSDITAKNVKKVTQFREAGRDAFEGMIDKFTEMEVTGVKGTKAVAKKPIYPPGRGDQFYVQGSRVSRKELDKELQ